MSTSLKTCFKCLEEKPLTEFYALTEIGDKRLNKCNSCIKKDAKKYRMENSERIKAFDRSRSKLPHRAAAISAYKKTEQGVAVSKAARKRWEQNNQHKRKATSSVNNAILRGKLQREPCFVCGSEAEAHHCAYDLPLHVTWLCDAHHKQVHNEHREYLRSIGMG